MRESRRRLDGEVIESGTARTAVTEREGVIERKGLDGCSGREVAERGRLPDEEVRVA